MTAITIFRNHLLSTAVAYHGGPAIVRGVDVKGTASVVTGFNVVEAPDVFAATGVPSLAGTFNTTEATDIMSVHGGQPDTGVWTDTEAPDVFSAYVFVAPSGTWASTEAPDTMGNGKQPRFEVEKVENGNSPVTISTAGPDRLLCMIVSTYAAGAPTDYIASITDTAGLVWNPQDLTDIGFTTPDNQQIHAEMWWAYAKDQLTNVVITTTLDGGFSFTHHLSALVHVKGMGGGFENPFSDFNPYSFGSNYALGSSASQMSLSRPVATGQLSASGGISNIATLDTGFSSGVTIDVTRLKATSTGSGSHSSYASIPVAQAKNTGRVYIEAKFVHIAGSKYGVGFSWASDSGNFIVGAVADGTNGFVVRGDGNVWSGGGIVGNVGCTPADGDIIGISIDIDNNTYWARDVTQNTVFNNAPAGSAPLPQYSTAHFNAGGITGTRSAHSNVSPSAGLGHIGGASYVIPFASTDGTSSSAEIDMNFGATAFAGTPPAGFTGWGTAAPAVTPTRIEQHAIVLGWDMSVPQSQVSEAPPGFTLHYADDSDISAGHRLAVYSKIIAQNILTTDNELMTHATPNTHWIMAYDTIVAGHVSPGTLESTEAADSFHAVGYGPGGAGQFGFFTPTETPDTFAATGYLSASGQWISFEAKDVFSAFISVPIVGTFDVTEAKDRFAGTGIGLGEDGVLLTTEALDIFNATGTVPISGSLQSTEAPDRFQALGAGVVRVRRFRDFFVT